MKSGRLRHYVMLQQRIESQNDMSEVVWTWEDVCPMWAEIAPLTGREFFAAQQVQAEATHNVTIRWRPGVTAKMRFIEVCEPSVAYDIVVPLADARRTEIVAKCKTREATGWRG